MNRFDAITTIHNIAGSVALIGVAVGVALTCRVPVATRSIAADPAPAPDAAAAGSSHLIVRGSRDFLYDPPDRDLDSSVSNLASLTLSACARTYADEDASINFRPSTGTGDAPGPMAGSPTATSVSASVAIADSTVLQTGRAVFESDRNACATCHRADLGGQIGPNLTDSYWRHGCTLDAIVADVQLGFPQDGMLPYGSGLPLGADQVRAVAAYVLSRQGSNPPRPKPRDSTRDRLCR